MSSTLCFSAALCCKTLGDSHQSRLPFVDLEIQGSVNKCFVFRWPRYVSGSSGCFLLLGRSSSSQPLLAVGKCRPKGSPTESVLLLRDPPSKEASELPWVRQILMVQLAEPGKALTRTSPSPLPYQRGLKHRSTALRHRAAPSSTGTK